MVQLNDTLLEVLDQRATETDPFTVRPDPRGHRAVLQGGHRGRHRPRDGRGLHRVPDDDELDALYEDVARRSIAEEPW